MNLPEKRSDKKVRIAPPQKRGNSL